MGQSAASQSEAGQARLGCFKMLRWWAGKEQNIGLLKFRSDF